MKRVAHIPIVAVAGLEVLNGQAALACAVCGLDGEPGFLWSMGFLISMPFLIAMIAGGYFTYNSRRAKDRASASKGIFSE